jgi:DNA-binding GntR family transcriptional regulator
VFKGSVLGLREMAVKFHGPAILAAKEGPWQAPRIQLCFMPTIATPRPIRTGPRAARGRSSRQPAHAPSQNEVAYDRLKEAVITLALKPSEYLNSAQLAERFGLGRTPVMRALDRLMTEGLVHVIPRKGVAVAPLSLDEARGLIEVRRVNEGYCLELAAERIDRSALDALDAILGRYDQAARQRNISALLAADRAFHETIAAASGNRVLANVLAVLHARSQRFWAMSLSRQEHIDEIAAEHEVIVQCLRKRDPAAARSAIERHVESFRSTLLR